MYVSVGLGVLTKGPIAVLLPGVVFALYLALYRELRRARDMMLPAGVLIVLAIVLPWYVALYQREGWGPIGSFFVGENIGRYTSGIGFPTARGLGFYVPVVFADAFPLSLFLIPAAVLLWRDRTRIHTLLWLWAGVVVFFFSFSHDKQDLYILPIVPAVAALGAAAISRRDAVPVAVRWTGVILGLVLAVCGAATLYVATVIRPAYSFGAVPLVGFVALAGGTIAGILAARRRVIQGVLAALTALLVVNWLLVVRILSDLEQQKPVPALTAFLQARITPQDVVATYNVALPSMVYYLQRRVNVYYAPERFIADASGSQRMFGVLSEADYTALHDRIRTPTCVLQRVPSFEVKLKRVLRGTQAPTLVLISNRCLVQ
jgi:4-amino-4-deoxy-L-arabinose transferase-like glycosyltransferase